MESVLQLPDRVAWLGCSEDGADQSSRVRAGSTDETDVRRIDAADCDDALAGEALAAAPQQLQGRAHRLRFGS